MEIEVAEQIGLDRICLTVKEEDLQMYNDNCITELNELEKAIQIRPNALNKGLYDVNITVPKLFAHTNEKNVTGDLLQAMPNIIQERLELYGIMLDVANANLGSFEINVNINDIRLYYVLKLIAKANINDNLKAFIVENKNGIQSVKVKKAKYILKVYKKSEHLQECFQSVEDEHLVRFEVSTNVASEKAKILGNNITLQGLIDNWEDIISWYRNCIKLTVKKPIEKYVEDMEKQILTMLEAGLKPQQIVDRYLVGVELIDLYPIESGIKKHYKKIKKANASRDIKRIHDRLKKANPEAYNQLVGNVEKLQQLYDVLGI